MIKFLIKGILRDRSRSLFPILVVALSVAMIIFFQGFMTGIISSFFRNTAVVSTGHIKIMTRAYEEENQLLPNDLAILETDQLLVVNKSSKFSLRGKRQKVNSSWHIINGLNLF